MKLLLLTWKRNFQFKWNVHTQKVQNGYKFFTSLIIKKIITKHSNSYSYDSISFCNLFFYPLKKEKKTWLVALKFFFYYL